MYTQWTCTGRSFQENLQWTERSWDRDNDTWLPGDLVSRQFIVSFFIHPHAVWLFLNFSSRKRYECMRVLTTGLVKIIKKSFFFDFGVTVTIDRGTVMSGRLTGGTWNSTEPEPELCPFFGTSFLGSQNMSVQYRWISLNRNKQNQGKILPFG